MENKIICGDCFEVLKKIKSDSVDFIYLDPPFSSNKNYVGFWQKTGEELVFDDHWISGVKGYIKWLKPRIKQCHRILKSTGSFYLHCDLHANAHIRIMLDEIFGHNNFRNELIWHYAKMGNASKNFLQNHDVIFFYTKTDDYYFEPQYLEEPSALRERFESLIGEDNTLRWKHVKNIKQQLLDSYIRSTKKRLGKKFLDNNDIILDFRLPEKGCKKVDNVFNDIPLLKGNTKERLGYPTQKPEKLLERLILASCPPSGVVLDPYCGCGTTIAVASKLQRKFIGIDLSRLAVRVMNNRLKRIRNLPEVVKGFNWRLRIPDNISDIKNYDWFNFQTWVNEKLGALQGKKGADGGIDGITFHQHTVIPCCVRNKNVVLPEGTLIQTKHFAKGSIGVPYLKKFESTLRQNKKTKGLIVGWEFAKGTYEYVLDAKERNINIYLLKANELYKLETLESPYKEEYKVGYQKRIE